MKIPQSQPYETVETPRWRWVLTTCTSRGRLRRTIPIALVVGTILTAINQGDVIVRGEATSLTAVKIAMNYIVPFVVSNLGVLVAGRGPSD